MLHDRVRNYVTIRTAHLERAHELEPATIVYARSNYDFDTELAVGLDLVQAPSILSLVRVIGGSSVEQLEINEPLCRDGIRRTAVAVAVARARGWRTGSRVQVVTYAIENRDPFGPAPRLGIRSRLGRLLDQTASWFVARNVDRIAYGTQAAEDLYEQSSGDQLKQAKAVLIPALPAPCDCPEVPKEQDSVLFLGALSNRKGFPRLVAAWPLVRGQNPQARLTIIGKGQLVEQAQGLAGSDSRVQFVLDPPRAAIHSALRRAQVLVLLSQPTATWREQVGLPIVEGLSHGCTVVASEQTGLAGWLKDHGHEVVDSSASAQALADAVVGALASHRSPQAVLADLPARDGRLAADTWLFEGR